MDKLPVSSNLQGLENEKPLLQGEPANTINFDSDRQIARPRSHSSGKIIKEKSDIYRLQDEDFRTLVKKIESGQQPTTDDIQSHHQDQNNVSEYDPVVRPDSKLGRLHLSIRYDDERSQLIVQIIDAQGMIRPEQLYSLDMSLTLSLIGNDHKEYQSEKHQRVIVDNAPVHWKEPVVFCISYEKMIEQKLHIIATNSSDPTAPRDREVFISLNNLQRHTEQINEWFTLQVVQSRS